MGENMKYKEINFKKIILLLIVISAILISGCEGKIRDFPEIDYGDERVNLPVTQIPISNIVPSGEINISLPLSEDCTEHLVYLFIQKISSLNNDTILPGSALTITLDELKSFRNGFVVIPEQSDPNGFNNNEILEMSLAGNLPDIFLVKNNTFYSNADEIYYDLSGDFLDSYINLMNIYPQMFFDLTSSGEVFTIPFHAKVKMLYLNRDALQGISIDPLLFDYPLTFNALSLITEAVAESQSNVIPWNSYEKLSLYLPGTIKPDFINIFNYSDVNRYDFINESYLNSLELIRELINIFPLESFGGNRNILFRIDYSDFPDISSINYDGISRFPVPVVDRISLPLSTISIAVNKNSEVAKFAKELAVFLSLDENALLFRSRFDLPEGFIPPINNPDVWERVVLRQKYGRDLYLVKEYMEYSFLMDPNYNNISDKYSYLYNKYVKEFLFSQDTVELNLEGMITEAKGIFDD